MRDILILVADRYPLAGWVLLVAVALLVAVTAARVLAGRADAFQLAIVEAFVVGALALVFVVTLTPVRSSVTESGWNLVPFVDLLGSRSGWATRLALSNLVLNVLLYIPFGIALAARFRAAGWLLPVAAGAALSVAIESLQVGTPGRVSDITDVLTNTLGMAIGVSLAVAARRAGPEEAIRR